MRRIPGLLVAVALLGGCGGGGSAPRGLDRISGWDGKTFLSSFGVPNTATYGQTITVADGATPMSGFAFEIGNCSASVTFHAYVYAWDGTKASGASLYTSDPVTLDASSAFEKVSFDTGSLSLPAGDYVLMASTSDDQGGMVAAGGCEFGARKTDDGYPGGQFVFLNNGAHPDQWTTVAWNVGTHQDLAFRVEGLR